MAYATILVMSPVVFVFVFPKPLYWRMIDMEKLYMCDVYNLVS